MNQQHLQAAAIMPSYVMGFLLLLPLAVLLCGTALGFSALRDIRASGGRLGGAMAAVLAAGLLPSILIVLICSSATSFAAEPSGPVMRQGTQQAWLFGALGGCWLSFLMMRSWYRQATGWEPPPARPADARSGSGTAALILTIVGAVMVLLLVTAPAERWLPGVERGTALLLLLAVLLGGLICGVLTRHEAGSRTCAWVCGVLLFFALLANA